MNTNKGKNIKLRKNALKEINTNTVVSSQNIVRFNDQKPPIKKKTVAFCKSEHVAKPTNTSKTSKSDRIQDQFQERNELRKNLPAHFVDTLTKLAMKYRQSETFAIMENMQNHELINPRKPNNKLETAAFAIYRHEFISWISTMQFSLELPIDAMLGGVALFDKFFYMNEGEISYDKEIIFATCLLLSTKIRYGNIMEIEDMDEFMKIDDFKNLVMQCEFYIMEGLEFDLDFYTPVEFLEFSLRFLQQSSKKLLALIYYLIEITLSIDNMISSTPNLLTCVCMCTCFMASIGNGNIQYVWNHEMQLFSGYQVKDLLPKINPLINYLKHVTGENKIFRKYSSYSEEMGGLLVSLSRFFSS